MIAKYISALLALMCLSFISCSKTQEPVGSWVTKDVISESPPLASTVTLRLNKDGSGTHYMVFTGDGKDSSYIQHFSWEYRSQQNGNYLQIKNDKIGTVDWKVSISDDNKYMIVSSDKPNSEPVTYTRE